MKKSLHRLISVVQRENLITIVLFILAIVVFSSLAISYFEPDLSLASGIWWSIVTLTTVGYGDISPTTAGGRVVAAVIMFFGIGLLGMLSANLATIMISNRIRESRGMETTSLKNHLIICEWNHRSRSILREIRADVKTEKMPVILIADIAQKPMDDPLLAFVSGTPGEETFAKANLQEATTVVVLGDDKLEPTARDAKVVLTTLTIETLNPEVYTVVEIVNKENKQHCLRANADEIIVGSELSSHLLATAATDHGMSTIISELVSSRYGNSLFAVSVPPRFIDSPVIDLMVILKTDYQATLLGIQKGGDGKLITNPDKDCTVSEGDRLVLMSQQRPEFP